MPSETFNTETVSMRTLFQHTNMENNDKSQKEQIIQRISELFLIYGLRSTSMDDIANHLRISKKTLYQHFKNKDDVVEQVMLARLHDQKIRLELQEEDRQNPIAIIDSTKRFIIARLNSLHPSNDFDMKKYHPEVYARIKDTEEKLKGEFLTTLLDQGIKQGYFRRDIDRDLQIYLLNTPLRYLSDPEMSANMQYPISDVVCTILDNFIRAISTEKGLQEIKKYEKQKNGDSRTM